MLVFLVPHIKLVYLPSFSVFSTANHFDAFMWLQSMAARVALITGSTRELGIGLGIATILAKTGTAIILHGTRPPTTDEVQKHRVQLAK